MRSRVHIASETHTSPDAWHAPSVGGSPGRRSIENWTAMRDRFDSAGLFHDGESLICLTRGYKLTFRWQPNGHLLGMRHERRARVEHARPNECDIRRRDTSWKSTPCINIMS